MKETKIKRKPNPWIQAFRLRTLPLAFAGIFLGSTLALYEGYFSWAVFLLALTTAFALQILSNLANDFGDSIKGTDNENRIGPTRAMQSGAISKTEMLDGIIGMASIAFLSGIILLFVASGLSLLIKLLFMVLGLAAIAAAVKYTVGENPYGYEGLGDVFVFIFFGLVAILGTAFLHQHSLKAIQVLPAAAFGLISVGVLNVNNMRDTINDYESGKITLAVRLGTKKARFYHAAILTLSIVCFIIYTYFNYEQWYQWLWLIAVPLFGYHLYKIFTIKLYGEFDPLLKQLALSGFAISILFGLGLILAYFL